MRYKCAQMEKFEAISLSFKRLIEHQVKLSVELTPINDKFR
jgi:hypothetical protein